MTLRVRSATHVQSRHVTSALDHLELVTHVSTSPDLQIPFFCGNHLVDITRGILHLYKDK